MSELETKDASTNATATATVKKGLKKQLKTKQRKRGKPKADAVRARMVRSYPASTFEEAMILAEAIQKFAAGQKVRRVTIFDKLGKSADSGTSRQLVTNSSKYGLTKGSYAAEFLELTEEGALATGEDVATALKLGARFELSIKKIEPFNFLYERCKGSKMPSKEFLLDALRELQMDEEALSECVDTFTLNVKYLGLLRTLSGTERLITLEHAIDETGQPMPSANLLSGKSMQVSTSGQRHSSAKTEGAVGFEDVCFYISPIGADESDQRKHADFFMEFVIEPALKEFGLRLIRADQIGKAGMIGKQVLEHVLKAKLVIADLSFHNPNVFYELCLRHATRLPTVQLIRANEQIPFDIDQYRTIKIDTADVYGFLPKIQTYTAEISNQVRRALEDGDAADNPISLYYPAVRLLLD